MKIRTGEAVLSDLCLRFGKTIRRWWAIDRIEVQTDRTGHSIAFNMTICFYTL